MTSNKLSVCIVGGAGVMGQWFHSFFSYAGLDVIIYDINTKSSLMECVQKANIVLISVPIAVTTEVIEQVCRHLKPGMLLVDNTSIKTFAMTAMTTNAPDGVEVLGMHTVFGPSTAIAKGKNVIFVKTASSSHLSHKFTELFSNAGANITFCDAQYHDKQVAFHQNLVHLVSFALGKVFNDPSADGPISMAFATPNSILILCVLCRFLHGDPSLYTEIQSYNTQKDHLLDLFSSTFDSISHDLKNNKFDSLHNLITKQQLDFGNSFIEAHDEILMNLQKYLSELKG